MSVPKAAGEFLKGLSEADYARISVLLDESIDMVPVEREKWLAALARDDPKSAALLRRMFAAQVNYEANSFLEELPPLVRRPMSFSAPADDIASYLGDEPVVAQRDSFGYRVLRFGRRHWLVIGVAGLLLLTLVARLAAS